MARPGPLSEVLISAGTPVCSSKEAQQPVQPRLLGAQGLDPAGPVDVPGLRGGAFGQLVLEEHVRGRPTARVELGETLVAHHGAQRAVPLPLFEVFTHPLAHPGHVRVAQQRAVPECPRPELGRPLRQGHDTAVRE
ncbi:hypothetical protein SALBM311S_09897 [Streptomyces alboniger]